MNPPLIHYFAESAGPACQLAALLGAQAAPVSVHQFPDGESLVRVAEAGRTALLYHTLDNPNAKLVELLLAASALRDRGAARVMLIAPYLGYMRQDCAFHPGEAISQRVIGRLLGDTFDGVMTIDPHLHRIAHLAEAIPDIPAVAVSATPLLAKALGDARATLLVGPDSESAQWVGAVARAAGLPFMVGTKQRLGDRRVQIAFPDASAVADLRCVLVDDLVASGGTLIEAARALQAAGAARIDALAVHCLASRDDLAAMEAAGLATIRATDTVASACGDLPTAELLADALRQHGWADEPGV